MDKEQTFRDALRAMEAQDWAKWSSLVTDDYTFSANGVPMVMNRDQFIGMTGNIISALPDWKFNVQSIQVNGDDLTCTLQVTGTHTSPLNLPMPGFPTVPPTGKKVSIADKLNAKFKGDKVVSVRSDAPAGGGMAGMLAALGVQLPG